MSEANAELVRRGYDIFNEGGIDALVDADMWAPDIVWDTTPTGIPGLGVYRGIDQARKFFDEWFGAFPLAELAVMIDELIEAGDTVVAVSRQRGRGSASGAAVELGFTQVFTVREGQITTVTVFLERAEAMAAAGLAG